MVENVRHILLSGATLVMVAAPAAALHVAEFGATPDDGQCDTQGINQAIQAAIKRGEREVVFAKGAYNLIDACTIPGEGRDNYVGLYGVKGLSLIGQVDADGRPATRLERNVKLDNDAQPPSQLSICHSANIVVKNFVLANNPPFGSTAKVISVDRDADEVVVEVLPGLPAYDGMRCASAHAWNLETGKLKRLGDTPAEGTLTIGLKIEAFWQAVAGGDERRLRMRGAGFAKKLAVGDGVSWHHKATDSHNQTCVMHSQNVTFENIIMPNVTNMGMLAGYNHNLTFRGVRFEPENGNVAVGGRDGLHLSMTSGRLLVEDCYFKGLRMDPLVLRKTFGRVREIRDDGAIVAKPGYAVPVGAAVRFWVGKEPQDRTVTRCEKQGGGAYLYAFAEALPSGVAVNAPVTYQNRMVAQGVIRNCVFEDSFGSAIVNFEENITVEGCTFDNNAYQIKYGANQVTGAFARNNVFRNNVCKNVSWIDIARRGQPAILTIHSLSRYFDDPMYNQHILIEGNDFRKPHQHPQAVAIDVRNASDVVIRGNTFKGFAPQQRVRVDEQTTRGVRFNE